MATTFLYYKNSGEIVKDLKREELKNAAQSEDGILWMDILNPEKSELDMIGEAFDLHPLTIEDCINTIARPKVDHFEKYLFIVLHAAAMSTRSQKIKTIELNVILGKNYIITIHQDPIKGLSGALERTQKNPAIMAKGADTVLHLVVDSLVDNYLPALDVMDYRITNIETQMLKNPTQKTLDSIFSIQKEILYLRRFIAPQRDTINFIAKEDFDFIQPKTKIYFRDVYDNLIFINDTIDNYRDVISSAIDVYISTISSKTNDIMKVLTIIATIMMPLTLISGIYGMNFKYMPILEWEYGFASIATVMITIGVGMLIYFRRKNWI